MMTINLVMFLGMGMGVEMALSGKRNDFVIIIFGVGTEKDVEIKWGFIIYCTHPSHPVYFI